MINKNGMTSLVRILAISAVAALVLMGTAVGEVSREGLVGEWHFDGDTKDSSGNRNDGTINGGAVFVDGVSGRALSFDGVDDYFNILHSSSLGSTGSFTIEGWIKTNQLRRSIIISKSDLYELGGYQWYVEKTASGVLQCYLSGDNIHDTYRNGTHRVNTGTWQHFACVYNSPDQTLMLYINGTEDAGPLTGVVPTSTYATGKPIQIGAFSSGRYLQFDGSFDDVRIYNRALSAEEVKTNFEAGQITVTSAVSGAEVLLDGIMKGSATPILTLYGISPGAHTVKCRLSGYLDYETSVNLPASSTVSATCSLVKPGSISVISSPSGADVYLDGTLKGTASLIIKDVIPGKHVIWCKKSGFEDFQQDIEVASGGVATFTCTLKPTNVTQTPVPTPLSTPISTPLTPISTSTQPNNVKTASITGKIIDAKTDEPVQGVIVDVDGKSATTYENGEYELRVDVGKHSMKVSKQGYETLARPILVPEMGKMLDLSL